MNKLTRRGRGRGKGRRDSPQGTPLGHRHGDILTAGNLICDNFMATQNGYFRMLDGSLGKDSLKMDCCWQFQMRSMAHRRSILISQHLMTPSFTTAVRSTVHQILINPVMLPLHQELHMAFHFVHAINLKTRSYLWSKCRPKTTLSHFLLLN